ncbi:WXG100 family type VII secretion target [Streptomyces sp. NPDC057555]|uniref:WXG100 family type VII secretion target n=1 Tax=Streptomyces sp. NPDC057555 TaxID=3346166 RepID=UPI0036B69C27
MGESGFRVEPEAIGSYGSTVSEQVNQLGTIQSAVSAITISSSAFGHLPNAQNLAEAYKAHADASRQNLSDLIEALTNTSEGLHFTAQNYSEHDQAVSSSFGGA